MKRNELKIGRFRTAPETALGTVDRVIVSNNLEVDHLSKQQVIAYRVCENIALGKSAC